MALVVFVVLFHPNRKQYLIDGLWMLAVGLWVSEWRARNGGVLLGVRRQWRDILPITAIVVAFVMAWMPFYDNWRWAYTGDGWGIFAIGYDWTRDGLHDNLLSVHGVDNSFTVLFTAAYSTLMFLVRPTFFWHRLTTLVFACGALVAIYAYFVRTVGRFWASAVVLAVATNHIWIWYTYVSHAKQDSYIFYFGTLVAALSIWRSPDRLGAWMACGVIGGLSLFFTPTAWSAVMAVGTVFGIWGLLTRRFAAVALYTASFLLAATPILLQLPDFIRMTQHQARSVYEWQYLKRIFETIVLLAYKWEYQNIGVQGPFLHGPLGPLYLVGVVLSLLAVLPPVRRALRVPVVGPVMIGLLLWDAILMTLTNNGYGNPSTKRIYGLIPIQVLLALVPLIVLDAWAVGRRWMQWSLVAVTAVLLAAYAVANLRVMMYPPPRMYGVNVYDGLIEMRQRHAERRTVLFTTREDVPRWIVGPQALMGQVYRLTDTVSVQRELRPEELRAACTVNAIACYEPSIDGARFDTMANGLQPCLKPLTLLNSTELRCVECDLRACASS